MGKRDVTDWTQKGSQNIKMANGPSTTDKIRDTAGKAGLLMCAAAVIAVLAKAVKNGGLDEYQESAQAETADKEPEDKEPADQKQE